MLGLCLLSLCPLLCADRGARDVLLCMGLVCHSPGVSPSWFVTPLLCHPTEPLPSPLPAFLLTDWEQQEGRNLLCWGDTVQLVSTARSGTTVMPDGFCHHLSPFLCGTRSVCCLGCVAACASGFSECSGCSQGSLRSCVARGLTLSFGYHDHYSSLQTPPGPFQQRSRTLCPERRHLHLPCHGLASKPLLLPGIWPPMCGAYLQRKSLHGVFFHIVGEHPQESFLFSVYIHSLGSKAQGEEQVGLILTKRECTGWINPPLYPACPRALAVVWHWLG